MRELLIAVLLIGRNGEPLYLASGYLFELRFPALAGAGDEQQDQAVPRFAELVVACTFHERKDAKYVLSWLVGFGISQPKIPQPMDILVRKLRAIGHPVVR